MDDPFLREETSQLQQGPAGQVQLKTDSPAAQGHAHRVPGIQSGESLLQRRHESFDVPSDHTTAGSLIPSASREKDMDLQGHSPSSTLSFPREAEAVTAARDAEFLHHSQRYQAQQQQLYEHLAHQRHSQSPGDEAAPPRAEARFSPVSPSSSSGSHSPPAIHSPHTTPAFHSSKPLQSVHITSPSTSNCYSSENNTPEHQEQINKTEKKPLSNVQQVNGQEKHQSGQAHSNCDNLNNSNRDSTIKNDNASFNDQPVCLKRKLFTIDSIIGNRQVVNGQVKNTAENKGLLSPNTGSGSDNSKTETLQDNTSENKHQDHRDNNKRNRDVFDGIPSPPPKITDIEKLKARDFSMMSYSPYAYLAAGRQIGHLGPAYAASLAGIRGDGHPGFGGIPLSPTTAAGLPTSPSPAACYQLGLNPSSLTGFTAGGSPYSAGGSPYLSPMQLSAAGMGSYPYPSGALRSLGGSLSHPVVSSSPPGSAIKVETRDLQ